VEVRERILSRAIQIDELINVDEVASELGVSRTPVLDAIKRLASEGLVEIKARRGTYVKGISEHDLNEIFQMREALELFAAKHVIEGHRHAESVAAMATAIEKMSVESGNEAFRDHIAFTVADKAFHGTLIVACDNQRMLSSYENLNIYMHIMRSHLYKDLVTPAEVHIEHLQIFEGVKNKDYAATADAIKLHLEDVRGRILNNIRENGGLI
jgi:DNA-binding GntR family transcriptional regulator